MEIFERNIAVVRDLWSDKKQRQALQLIVYQALANTTNLPAKEVDNVLDEIGRLVEIEEEAETRPDPAL